MTTINNFKEAFWSNSHCDRCRDISCGFNKLFMKYKALSAGFAVPAGFCQNINSLISNDNVEVSLRIAVKQALINDDFPKMPGEPTETAKTEWMQKAIPICMSSIGKDR